MAITRERINEWLQDEVTIARKKGILEKVKNLREILGDGATLGETSDLTAIQTARIVGRIEGLIESYDLDTNEAIIEEE